MLQAASEVTVIDGAGYDPAHRQANARLLVERDSRRIAEIAELLCDTVPGATGMDWMEWPEVSFVFLSGRRVLRELGLLSRADHVRDAEYPDLPLCRPLAVDDWLRAAGVHLRHPPARREPAVDHPIRKPRDAV